MNKSFRSILLAVLVAVVGGGVAQAQGRVATVELTQVFQQYWKTKQAQLALQTRKNDLKEELEKMQETHKKLLEDVKKMIADANDQAVSSEEREKRKKALEPKRKELGESDELLKAFISRGDSDLATAQSRMMEDVIKDIRAAVASKAKSNGYAYVFDSSAESMSRTKFVLFDSGEADLTKQIIDHLNATAPLDAVEKTDKK